MKKIAQVLLLPLVPVFIVIMIVCPPNLHPKASITD